MAERWNPEQEVGVQNPPPQCSSLSKTLYSPKVLIIPRKRWVRPDMTAKIVDWDVKPQHKQTNKQTSGKKALLFP